MPSRHALRSTLSPSSLIFAFLLVAIGIYAAAPLGDHTRSLLYDGVGVVSVALGFARLQRHVPALRRSWSLVLAGYAGWVLADIVWTFEQRRPSTSYPAPSDFVYLASYVFLVVGVLSLTRTRTGQRDGPAVLDASIMTVSAAVAIGAFLVAPLADQSTASTAAQVVSSAYPLADLFVLGVMARLYVLPGTKTLACRILMTSLAIILLCDLAYDVHLLTTGDTSTTSWLDTLWLLGYVLAAAAVSVASAPTMVASPSSVINSEPSRGRLMILVGGLLLPGVVLLIDGTDDGKTHWPLIGVGMLVLSVLVLMRMLGLINTVRAQAQQLAPLVRLDHLTGVPNRRSWDHELARACAVAEDRGSALSVAILDLDRFKTYNDTYGHQAGDRLLQAAVSAWSVLLPDSVFLARYGGEEFGLLMPSMPETDVVDLLNRLRSATPEEQTFSAGVAHWSTGDNPQSLVEAADTALYGAKRGGRDQVKVHQAPTDSAVFAGPGG